MMHRALQIQEILLNIFGHCHRPRDGGGDQLFDVAALARTCRVFKEPALDVLWEKLYYTLSPLARCLPGVEASHKSSSGDYSFHRPLTRIEWDILRSYTRRVRSIDMKEGVKGLSRTSLISLSKPPGAEPLFSNVRYLRFQYTPEDKHLLLLPLPSLLVLDIQSDDQRSFERSLKSFAKFSPNLTRLLIHLHHDESNVDMDHVDPRIICRWQNLQTVDCNMRLDVITLVHLSRMPALTCLSFTLRSTLPDQISPSDPPLIFSNLDELSLHSQLLDPIIRLLSQIRLPAISDVSAFVEFRPSRRDLSSFLAGVQTSGSAHAVRTLWLVQDFDSYDTHVPEDRPVLVLEDLRPYMEFSNLRCINLAIEWKVDLTDSELLALASKWPHLEKLLINTKWGWNTQGGITPNGLLQLLQACQLLTRIALAIDTRGYTEIPPSPVSLGLTLARLSFINVLDSLIEEECVPAITAFFLGVLPRPKCYFTAWKEPAMGWNPNRDVCQTRWKHVCRQIKDAATQSRGHDDQIHS
ncbi:hypothetical protein L210DRAFT_3540422 [Boletus edulis BED1]|uniref:F-box domain-containing protein n=1 Tax=Boletus edulis BED1 TaxID=1328754 RepID=A0AAD4BUI3_BOLED|nr:hypothetical protein L210DRAFT_3540422 [Boletus edulis BED1]